MKLKVQHHFQFSTNLNNFNKQHNMTTATSNLKDPCTRSGRLLRAEDDKPEVETRSFDHGMFYLYVAHIRFILIYHHFP